MGIQDHNLLDFEDFSTDHEKLSAILKRTEVSSQKHKLAYEYYRARKFLLLLPSLLSCIFIGVLGFLVTTDAIKMHMKAGDVQVEDLLTILIGCLGVFVGMVILMGNRWDFGSREKMHLSALVDLESLGDRMRFHRMDQQLTKNNNGGGAAGAGAGIDDSGRSSGSGANERRALGVVEKSHKVALVVASGKALKKVESAIHKRTEKAKKTEESRSDVVKFSGYHATFNQINRSCKSTIPLPISRPFDLFESRLECMSLGHLGVVWDTRMRRNQIMRLAAVEIYNEISGYWLWPLDTPDMDDVIDKSMKRAARLVSKDYRAPVKVQCCGFTIFRCCCRAKNPKNSLLNTIFDGIEDREMDIRETRQVGNYIESGERRWEDDDGGNLLEDRAYEADRRFGYLEDGRRGGDRYRDYDRGDGDYGDDYTESSASMYSRGQRTKESGSYTREIAGGSYAGGDSRRGGSSRRSAQSRRTEHSGSRGTRSKRSGRSGRGGQSLSETLTRSEVTSVGLGWDEASESQFG